MKGRNIKDQNGVHVSFYLRLLTTIFLTLQEESKRVQLYMAFSIANNSQQDCNGRKKKEKKRKTLR